MPFTASCFILHTYADFLPSLRKVHYLSAKYASSAPPEPAHVTEENSPTMIVPAETSTAVSESPRTDTHVSVDAVIACILHIFFVAYVAVPAVLKYLNPF